MIKYLFLTIPSTVSYEQLKKPLHFSEDTLGVTNWVMKFPLSIYSDDLSEKHVFTENKVQVSQISNANLQQRWKYFVITRNDGHRYYCASHTFYERSPLQKKKMSIFTSFHSISNKYMEFYLPKCLVIYSENSHFKLQTNLIKIYRELRHNNTSVIPFINEQMLDYYQFLISTDRQTQWENCPPITNGKQFSLSIENNFQYFIKICNSTITGQKILINSLNNVEIMHLYNIGNTLYHFNYFFYIPSSSIDNNNNQILLKAMTGILQQKQIIVTSNNQNSNVMFMETILQMILPFKWDFMYVPALPEHLIDVIQQAFMPFLIGVHKKYLSNIDHSDKIVIYLDTSTIYIPENQAIEIPQCLKYFIKIDQLEKNYLSSNCGLSIEKQLRKKSLMAMIAILEQCQKINEHYNLMKLSFSQLYREFNYVNVQDKLFFEEFVNKSTMYKRFTEQKHSSYENETNYLLKMRPLERKQYIQKKFNILQMQAQFPAILSNQKQIIRYHYGKKYPVYKENFHNSKRISADQLIFYKKVRLNQRKNTFGEEQLRNYTYHPFISQMKTTILSNSTIPNFDKNMIKQSSQASLIKSREQQSLQNKQFNINRLASRRSYIKIEGSSSSAHTEYIKQNNYDKVRQSVILTTDKQNQSPFFKNHNRKKIDESQMISSMVNQRPNIAEQIQKNAFRNHSQHMYGNMILNKQKYLSADLRKSKQKNNKKIGLSFATSAVGI